MAEYTTQDAVKMAMAGNVNDFRNAIGDILTQRVRDSIEVKRTEVAASFMSAETDEVEEIEGEPTDDDQEIQ